MEISQKNKATYQYHQLKHQMNPHFLFNSLNSLDYLIHTDPEKASDYVKSLASLYRHFMNVCEEGTILLQEEVEFVQLYTQLLSQRFDNSLKVTIDVDKAYLNTRVIPCCLQTLVENATKHNIVSKDKPLSIDITTEQGYLVVRNNLQPKVYKVASTGVGLKNISGQYKSLFGKDILINKSNDTFEVRLPIEEHHS